MPSPPLYRMALVVDDDDFVRNIVGNQLKTIGVASVLTAANWPAARAQLEANPSCDVVISDLDMPGASGSTFLEELAISRPGIALVIVSALTPLVLGVVEKQVRKLALRVLGVVPKPTSLDGLRALLAPQRDGGP